MPIIGIKAFQDQGKTALGIGVIEYLCFECGYSFDEVVANVHLLFPVYPEPTCLNNTDMKKFVRNMVTNHIKHKIIFLDEADRLFPARFWQKADQTDALIGLWQDFKLFNYIIWTGHAHTGVDLVLREVTHIELNPRYDPLTDSIPFDFYNQLYGVVGDDRLLDVSKNVFPYYDRWEVVN